MQKSIRLLLDGFDDLGMAMPDKRGPESGGEVDVSIAVGIDHVGALRFNPDDWIVVCACALLASFSSGRERGAFTRRETFHPRSTYGRRNRVPDGWKRLAELHACFLARCVWRRLAQSR